MNTEKKKRGRPPKQKVFETTGMTYEGMINNALDQEIKSDLDKNISDKSEDELTDDERKYLKRKKGEKVLYAECAFYRIRNARYSCKM